MATVIRVSRHPLVNRTEALQKAFGPDVKIVLDDFRFGGNPQEWIANLEAAIERTGDKVVAVESSVPLLILAQWLQARREFEGVKFLRAEFVRDDFGRAKVAIGDDGQPLRDEGGREILVFDHYEVVKRVVIETEPLSS